MSSHRRAVNKRKADPTTAVETDRLAKEQGSQPLAGKPAGTRANLRPLPDPQQAATVASRKKRMPLVETLAALRAFRTDEIVVTAMGAAREWLELGTHPLDFVFVPSSMGQASSLGLGLALAQPQRQVIVCNGDGSTLMNLGSLVTITAVAPANMTLIVFDNGVYEVTGSQSTPGAAEVRRDRRDVDYCQMARACGFRSVFEIDALDDWKAGLRTFLEETGPTFVLARIEPMRSRSAPRFPGPPQQRGRDFMAALQSDPGDPGENG